MTGETIAGVFASKTEEHIELQVWSSGRRRGSHIFICLIYVEVSFILVIIIPCKKTNDYKLYTCDICYFNSNRKINGRPGRKSTSYI
jgi:hypothetical protein